MESNRPVLKLTLRKTDVLSDILSLAAIILLWVYILINYSRLPAIIPIHYNGAGKIDGHGSKTMVFVLPAITTFTSILLTILNRYPHVFNYPTAITEENAKQQYTLATRLIRHVKLIIIFMSIFITVSIVRDAHDQSSGLGWWTIPVFSVLILIPLILYFYHLKKPRFQISSHSNTTKTNPTL